MMMQEHESAGDALARLRQRSNDYQAPEQACISFRTLYEALAEFEADLHQHIHLENNILFPKAVELEKQVRGSRPRTEMSALHQGNKRRF